jgi:hypothetical protein
LAINNSTSFALSPAAARCGQMSGMIADTMTKDEILGSKAREP